MKRTAASFRAALQATNDDPRLSAAPQAIASLRDLVESAADHIEGMEDAAEDLHDKIRALEETITDLEEKVAPSRNAT